jgi:protein crumbs
VEVLLPDSGDELFLSNFTFGSGLNDGAWHTVVIRPSVGLVTGEIDGGGQVFEEYLEENSTVSSLAQFVTEAVVVVGSGGLGQEADYFRGCMEEVRIGGVLLPFFTEEDLINSTPESELNPTQPNSTASQKFVVDERGELTMGECVLCYQTECQNGGSCADPSDQFQCSCMAGFNGPFCEVNIDECQENGCVNGVCVDKVNNYTCECRPGWNGRLCDQDLDECETLPCQHGGICTQSPTPGDYSCQCPQEYKGKDCQELKVKTCQNEPCQNGGRCIPEEGGGGSEQYRCDCPNGYEGINCQNQTDFCVKLSMQCEHGGTCYSDFSSFTAQCRCRPGYTGRQCQTEIDECEVTPPPCGTGRCQDRVNGFQCDCSGTGFTGTNCQLNINECLTNPCQHNAHCNDTAGSYRCLCYGEAREYCGQNCHVPNPCGQVGPPLDQHRPAPYPPQVGLCQNEGSCVHDCDDADGDGMLHKCQCGEGWEGKLCTLKVGRRGTQGRREEEDDNSNCPWI